MRKHLAKEVREQLAHQLQAELPHFQKISHGKLPPGYVLYQWKAEDDLSFFLLLELDRNRDRFTLEVSWSRKNRWPENVHTMLPSDEPVGGELRFRLSRLWAPTGVSFWWEIVPEPKLDTPLEDLLKTPPPVEDLLPRTRELVDDAISRLKNEGMAYFGRILQQTRGVTSATPGL